MAASAADEHATRLNAIRQVLSKFTRMRGLGLPVYHPNFDSEMAAFAMYERIKFSSGQKVPLPTGFGVARIFNDVTSEQVLEALDEWAARCAAK